MQDHKKYFEMAYRTGTDTWTHLPLETSAGILAEKLPAGAMILDIGCGRGLRSFYLARMGFRVIGIDYLPEIIAKDNEEAKNLGLGRDVRFVDADALDIPFTDEGFDGALNVGLLHNLPPEEYSLFAREASRVLRPKGYLLNISHSKETVEFLAWHPKKSEEGTFTKDGVQFHFFTKEKIADIFKNDFEIIEQTIQHIDSGKGPGYAEHHGLAYVVTLMRKK
jgi:ubiquinone/menaquinone biosynthesis C-methylase UbiE